MSGISRPGHIEASNDGPIEDHDTGDDENRSMGSVMMELKNHLEHNNDVRTL